MNRTIRSFALLAATAGLVACGGSATTSASAAASKVPDYSALSMDVAGDNGTAAQAPQAGGTATPAAAPDSTAPSGDACHPHLFGRTNGVSHRINRALKRVLDNVRDVIEDHPKLQVGQTVTWERVDDGIDRKFTLTETAAGAYTFEFDVSKVGATTPAAKVYWGDVVATGSGATAESKGDVHFDFTARAQVITRDETVGQVDMSFDNTAAARSMVVDLKNFEVDNDAHNAALAFPQNGHYVLYSQPEKGGSLKYSDALQLACGASSTTATTTTQLSTLAQWYKSSAGYSFRADSEATGGQVPTGDTWMGATCAHRPVNSNGAEGFWMMKLEDAKGATLQGGIATVGTDGCDAAFKYAQPDLAGPANDFPFASIHFTDNAAFVPAPLK